MSIMIYMYLSKVVDNEDGINYLINKLGTSSDLEIFLRNQFSESVEKGYPDNPGLELKLKNHLHNLIKNQNNISSISNGEI